MSDEYFMLLSSDTNVRLKSFSGTFSGKRASVRIQLELDDPETNLGYMLRQLEKFQAAQKEALKPQKPAQKQAQRKKLAHSKPLALPAPDEAMGE